jgi:iron chelate ABC transporter, ATP-binding protein
LEALAECPIRNLSGGQWQRTLLARALVSQPRLLLLDEPDTHLDRNAKQELYASLLREHTRRAIVLVSHDEQLELPSGAKILNIE